MKGAGQTQQGAQNFGDGEKIAIAVGPWGSQGGFRWDDGVYSTVRQVVIAHGGGIDSIQIEYDKKGTSVWSEKHGGNGGTKINKVKLDFPDEFLTSVHGHYGCIHEWGPIFVRSLTFESNRRAYGPFGVEQGMHFSFPMTGGRIVGFHGKSSWYLDAIGLYLKPLQQQSSIPMVQPKDHANMETGNMGYSVTQRNEEETFVVNPISTKLATQSSQEFDGGRINENVQAATIEKLPSKAEGAITYGPWGGGGGRSAFDDGIYKGIRQILLSRNNGLVSIRVQYDRDGEAVWGSKHGGAGGFKTDKIIFDYPSEILTHISGTYGPKMYMGPNVVKSLTFYTNKGKHGPFGEAQGPSFGSMMNEGRIVGFHGREGLFLDAIGVHVMGGKVKRSLSDAIIQTGADVVEIDNSPWSSKLVIAKRGQTEEVSFGILKEPSPCGSGPWGGDGGKGWDDGVFSGIKQMYVTREKEAICSIQFEYDRNGQSVWSAKHGGSVGTSTNRVNLEYPHEVLVCVSGYYGPMGRDERSKVIRSLTFHSSRGKYGPFGEEIGSFFTSMTTEGKVVGFHGRSSFYLDAIGVHMQHWLGNNKTSIRSSLFKIFS